MMEEPSVHSNEKKALEISGVTGRDFSSQIQDGGDFDIFFGRNSSYHQSFDKAILSQFSSFFSSFDGSEWYPYKEDTVPDENKKALWNCLRLCYGGPTSISIQDSVSTLEWLLTLSINRDEAEEDLVTQVSEFIVKCAREDCVVGAKLLRTIPHYKACCIHCYPSGTKLTMTLSEVVFSSKNIASNYPEVIDGCLMKLPTTFLDWAQFPSALHELVIRIRYDCYHGKDPLNEQSIVKLASQEAESLTTPILARVSAITRMKPQMPQLALIALTGHEETAKQLHQEIIQMKKNEEDLLQKIQTMQKEMDGLKLKLEEERRKATAKITGEGSHTLSFKIHL